MSKFSDNIIKLVKHHIPFNNKGILIPLYFIASIFIAAFLFNSFQFKPINSLNNDEQILFLMSVACLFTSLWIYFTRNDYYEDKEGNKVKVDINNSFLFIKMIYWSAIFFIIGIGVIIKLFAFN